MSSLLISRRPTAGTVQSRLIPRQRHRLAIVVMSLIAAFAASKRAMAQMKNMPPMADNDYAMTVEDQPTVIKILSNDFDMSAALNPASVEIGSYPLYGTIIVSPTTGNVLYTPDPGFYGTDRFEYTVADVNGNVSNVASVMIAVMGNMSPPVITNFTSTRIQGNEWEFSGTVSDSELSGIVVTFGGLISGSTTTDADGAFSYTVTLAPGAGGPVSAQATNEEGLSSSIAYDYVLND